MWTIKKQNIASVLDGIQWLFVEALFLPASPAAMTQPFCIAHQKEEAGMLPVCQGFARVNKAFT